MTNSVFATYMNPRREPPLLNDNPSVACTDYSDPTLRKMGKFARAWGCGGQLVGNVQMILEMAALAKTVVLAYPNARSIAPTTSLEETKPATQEHDTNARSRRHSIMPPSNHERKCNHTLRNEIAHHENR